jgi:hypothetical protein
MNSHPNWWLSIVASTFHNGLAATNENLVFNFANNGDFTPRYPMWIKSPISSYEYSYFS